MPINNESIGISAEVAIAQSFGVRVNPYYEAQARRGCGHISVLLVLLQNKNHFAVRFSRCSCKHPSSPCKMVSNF